jgi:hypothetical protein
VKFNSTARYTPINVAIAEGLLSKAINLSLEQSCEAVLEEAEAIVPVDTGELRESGHVEAPKDNAGRVVGSVVFDADHAAYVEYGTGIRGASSEGAGDGPYNPNWPGMVAQPYLRPALDKARPHILEIFQDNVAVAARLIGK